MEPLTEEVLFDRMVCAEASDEDWALIEHISTQDGHVWRRLAWALEDHARLVQLVRYGDEAAETVTLAAAESPWRRWTQRSGWLAAAAVALMWLGTTPWWEPQDPPPPPPSTEAPPEAPRAEGVSELPAVLVGTRELPHGEVEVTYLRRLVERRTANALYEHTTDEWGKPSVVPARASNTWKQEL